MTAAQEHVNYHTTMLTGTIRTLTLAEIEQLHQDTTYQDKLATLRALLGFLHHRYPIAGGGA